MDYASFVAAKTQLSSEGGIKPLWIPDWMFDFQKHLLEWNLRRGRSATLADCGMGKGPLQLAWAQNLVQHANLPALIATPLAVARQFVDEGAKFGIDCFQSRDGNFPGGARVIVTNYEQLHKFNASDFSAVSCDESSILKSFEGVRRSEITEFLRMVPYRLLCTATASPNDYIELGTHSEALGELGYMDMLSRFFKNEKRGVKAGAVIGGGEWRFRGHAEQHFWRWVCSWARAARKPSDLGPFSDERFILPPLEMREHVVDARFAPPGRLFDTMALTTQEQLDERRRTIPERCERAAQLLSATDEPSIAWCNLNPEGDLLEKLISSAVQVAGCDPDERKEEVLTAFYRGEIKRLVSKTKIRGFGMNFQHCALMSFFPSHSFEQMYQGIRRCWRFGQTRPVRVEMVTSEGALGVLNNLQRKARQSEEMWAKLVEHMHHGLEIQRNNPYTKGMQLPSWLS